MMLPGSRVHTPEVGLPVVRAGGRVYVVRGMCGSLAGRLNDHSAGETTHLACLSPPCPIILHASHLAHN